MRTPWLVIPLAGLSAGAALAQQPTPPASVAARIAQLDAACRQAGGQPVAQPYVFVHDFTGDRRNDFLVSEGNYGCQGQPGLFVTGGAAFVEIWVADERGGAAQAFRERVRGYRILNSQPRTVQLVRIGPACGPGQAPTATCPATLAWNAASRSFGAAGAAPTPAAGAPVGAPAPAPVQAAAAPMTAETQAAFTARCRREYAARHPGAGGAAETCVETWGRAQAAAPAADMFLALAGQGGDLAAARSKMAGVAWRPRPEQGSLANGRLAQWEVSLLGRAAVEEAAFRWSKVGDFSPYDMVEALKMRGARVTEVACQGFGPSEQTHVYRVETPGRAPFRLSVYDRHAATANQEANYVATLDMRGAAPTLAALQREPNGSDWQARCE